MVFANRRNAKKEKIARNRLAARRYSQTNERKISPFRSKEFELVEYQCPFKYTQEEAAAEVLKVTSKK